MPSTYCFKTGRRSSIVYGLLALVLAGASASAASAAPQVIVRYSKYTLQKYDISFSRVHGPSVFEMDASYNDISLVAARVQALKSWDASMPANSSWHLAVILIETNQDPATVYANIVKTGTRRPLQDYLTQIKDTYERVKNFKTTATSYTSGLADTQFRQVNQLITDYNNLRQEAVSAYGSAPFASYPSIALMQWYYQIRYNGQLYYRGPFATWNQMANDYSAVKSNYPTIVLVRYFAK